MCALWMRWLCVVAVAATSPWGASSEVVRQISSCLLRFDNGSEINLMKVAAEPLYAPRFKDIPAKNISDRNTYYYNPCYSYEVKVEGVPVGCNNDVAVCQGSKLGYYNVGTQSSATFHYSNETGKWMISYKSHNGNRMTNVTLQCGDSHDSLYVWGETQEARVYKMTLTSRCACVDGCGYPILPRGMSLGSFLLLLLLLAIIMYLLIGYIYRRFVIGARGIELFPHLSFWRDFPFLVQDGFFFLIKCGQDDLTYERI